MAFDPEADSRISRIVDGWTGVSRKKMFGGICYLLKGNMFCGVYREFLILRLGEKGAGEALTSDYVRSMDVTGRPMKGWVMVRPEGYGKDEELEAWLEEARDFVMTLPAKEKVI